MSEHHRSINFDILELKFDKRDRSVEAYAQRGWYEEYQSEFYSHISNQLRPELLLDIGANYGVVSVFMKRVMPDVALVCVEPNPELLPFIEGNLGQNGFQNYQIIQAVIGRTNNAAIDFHINPAGSQDSRVIAAGDGWRCVRTQQVTIADIIKKRGGDRVFIKIDSQGYEESIFAGAESFLKNSNHWIIKTEFAPQWLVSQGTNPHNFLKGLIETYTVTEFPSRYSYFTNYEKLLRDNPLTSKNIESYLNYVINLGRHDRGWVDLLIGPKQK